MKPCFSPAITSILLEWVYEKVTLITFGCLMGEIGKENHVIFILGAHFYIKALHME